jgi:hypothetical protein
MIKNFKIKREEEEMRKRTIINLLFKWTLLICFFLTIPASANPKIFYGKVVERLE